MPSLVALGLLTVSAQAAAKACEPWCKEPCKNLGGDVNIECGGCPGPDGCHPGSFGEAPKPVVEKNRQAFRVGCKEWCVEPCTQLMGDLQKECGSCPTPKKDPEGGYKCYPGAKGHPQPDPSVKRTPPWCSQLKEPGVEMMYERIAQCGPQLRPNKEQLDNATVLMPVWSDDLSAMFLVHDAPIFVSEMPLHMRERINTDYLPYIRRMEPEWRRRNGGTLQVNFPGATNGYALFQEAIAEGGKVEAFARDLFAFIRDRWLKLMMVAPMVMRENTTTAEAKDVFGNAIGPDLCEGIDGCPGAPGVGLDSWINVFFPDGESFSDQFHGHMCQWHGYLGLNVTDTATSFVSPFDGGKVFTLKHTQNYLITLPAGLQHAAHPPAAGAPDGANPRITQAFDIRILDKGQTHKGLARMSPNKPISMDFLEDFSIPSGQRLSRWDYKKFNALVLDQRNDKTKKVTSNRLVVDYGAGHYLAQGKSRDFNHVSQTGWFTPYCETDKDGRPSCADKAEL